MRERVETAGAPCRDSKQVFYSFYKLARGSRGGGPELVLTYGEKSICTAAGFQRTR